MTKATLVALAAVLIMAGPAFAGGRHGGHGGHGHGGPRLRSSLPTRVGPQHHPGFDGHGRFGGHQRFHGQQRFFGHQRFFRHGGGFGAIVAPPVITYGTTVYAVPEYVLPPPSYPPASSYAPAPSYAPSPMQTVVEFPNGRYVLHGDGITTPYRWVWIPNPPPPPAEEPAVPPPPPAPAAAEEPVRPLEFYRWTDDAGVTHYSDTLDRVPEAYRSRATRSKT